MESDMGEADPAFKKAREEYSEIGYSPTLTKEQLKMTILLRRVSEGKDEPEIEKTRDIKHPLSKEEMNRIAARRKCNRVSAQKSREKKKQETQEIFQTVKEHELRKKDLEAKVSEMESEKAKMLKILSESFSQQQQTVITPVDVMGLVNFILQNGAVDGQIQSDISSTNIQIQTEPPTPNTFNVAGMNCTQTTSDFNIQTGESFRGHLSHELCDLEGRGSADLSCCSDFEMAQCSNNFVFNQDFLADDY